MNENDATRDLQELGLSHEEALIYLELLQGPRTHLQLSSATGVNRTKVYRLIDVLQQKSLVSRRVDDRGSFLIASDPTALEVALIAEEERVKQRRQVLGRAVPLLMAQSNKDQRDFIVRTYDGTAGLKQMCWHELKTKGELLSIGNGTTEQMAEDDAWALRHRRRHIENGYRIREIINYDYTTKELPDLASDVLIQSGLYSYRFLAPSLLQMENQTVIYNDTVGIYHWKQSKKVGIEIISGTYANMMRQIFEQYWQIAENKDHTA